MATNIDYEDATIFSVVVTNPSSPVSGDPVRYGSLTGLALTDEGDGGNGSTKTSVHFGTHIATVTVDDNEGSGIAVGDVIYYHDTGTGTGSVHLNNSATGANAVYGIAEEVVTANATTAIMVRHFPFGFTTAVSGTVDTGQIATNAVTTVKITDANVTVAKLGANLQIGYIPLPLASWRVVTTNDISAKGAIDGGVISLDTDPTYKRVNGATDKKGRIAWAATSVVEIQQDIAYPADLDDTAAVTLHFLFGMGGAMDTPVVAVGYFEAVGDTNAGGNTAALAATVADKSVVIASGDVGTYPNSAAVTLIPAAHANDAIYLYGSWATYQRKS